MRRSASATVVAEAIIDANANYQRMLAEYETAQQQHESLAQAYWKSVGEMRLARNAKRRLGRLIVADDCVLAQPPKYIGPTRPIDPTKPEQTPLTAMNS
jgi:hypothetical protein